MTGQGFYESEVGDRLVDPKNIPPAIARFLAGELTILNELSPSFDLLIEVGCMNGRFLDWAAQAGKSYLGIDVVARYVKTANNRCQSFNGAGERQYRALLGSADHLDVLAGANELNPVPKRSLALFPFNSFGNIKNPLPVIRALSRLGAEFMISSYLTTVESTEARREYYESCSYSDLTMVNATAGVLFTATEGLWSIAYHPEVLLSMFQDAGLRARGRTFSDVGVAYQGAAG
jgi:hypothetical protein